MVKKLFIYIFLFILSSIALSDAQDIEYAKSIIKTLSSPEFHGRGYVNDGLAVTADFITSEFKKNRLEPLFDNYIQQFTIPVNSFPGKMELSLNNIPLLPASEFIVDPSSPGLSGIYPAVIVDNSKLIQQKELNKRLKEAAGKFLVINNLDYGMLDRNTQMKNNDIIRILKFDPRLKIAGVIELTDAKLSWNVSTITAPRPSFLIKSQINEARIESIKVDIENRFFKEYTVCNLAGFVKGTIQPDSFIVFTAHYDHLGQMGQDVYFPGANDNASGVAMILNLASYYTDTKPAYSLIFIALAGEEAGLLGSKYFNEHSPIDLKKIKFLINLDLVGNGEDGITVVNGSVYKDLFNRLIAINTIGNYFTVIKPRGEACNSDHCYFYLHGVPCFFIYTMGGTQAYHDLNDTYDSLSLNKFSELSNLIIEFFESNNIKIP